MLPETDTKPPALRPIMKTGVRILRPNEWTALHLSTTRPDQLDALFYTGMRYVEIQRLYVNQEWFQEKFVFLPKMAIFKAKRLQQERWVKLNPQGQEAIKRFLKGSRNLPSWSSWGEDLRRWATQAGLEPTGLGPKTTRKTWESWLVVSYPMFLERIFLQQGHAMITSFRHYINLPFTYEDRELMKPYVSGIDF